MTLTEEQRKRMEENRKRAIEIKRKKQLENETSAALSVFDAGGFVVPSSSEEMEAAQNKKRRINGNDDVPEVAKAEGKSRAGDTNSSTKNNSPGSRNNTSQDARNEDDDESSLEDFERDASPYISQTEAQRTYCIPKGTLEVCSYIEKDNPIKRGFSKMKLYERSEVRRRARKRFGGKEGLIRERERRKKKRFEKDLAETKDVFR